MSGYDVWPPKPRRAEERREQRALQNQMAEVTPPSDVARKMLNGADSLDSMAARLSIYIADLETYHGPQQRWGRMRLGIETIQSAAAVLREIATETGA